VAEAAKAGRPLPGLPRDTFAPVAEPTVRTGVRAMSLAVLNLAGK
jgi:hippurate hydrolase